MPALYGEAIVKLNLNPNIIGIFTNFFGWVGGFPTGTVDWHYLLINSIKSTPVMIALLFTIKQYVRERTF